MTLHYTIISKMPYILRVLKLSQVYTLTNFCSQKYCQQFLYNSHLKLSSLSYYTSTHLFNCQFNCSNQGPVPKQKEFLRSGLSRACTNRVWLLAFFVERAWMACRALTSSKIYLTFIIHLFQVTCHAFFLSHMFFFPSL